jgi:superfamily II DNA or RNA helicase/SAM-dependent methyltransferase/SOS-response transcriptional repressor LexA
MSQLEPTDPADPTIDYYSRSAESFFVATSDVDMTPLYARFLASLPSRARILDAGCGSGRDAKAFAAIGHDVVAFDASPELARLASAHCGFEIGVRTFDEVDENEAYDGIWCCASLLHVPRAALGSTMERLWDALRRGGTFYASFKLGRSERMEGGRRFTDLEEEELRELLHRMPGISTVETWVTRDQRPERQEHWVNVVARRQTYQGGRLVTGGTDPFLPHLSRAIASANQIDLAVAFVKVSGLRLLMADLLAGLEAADDTATPRCRLRILTSDYLDVTDPEALRLLLLMGERGAEVKVFTTVDGGSFHLKAYIFARVQGDHIESGTAFIGSSNITRQALHGGLEWNYRVAYPSDPGFFEARKRFDELFAHQSSQVLTDAWIDAYERRRVQPLRPIAPGSAEVEPPPVPHPVQQEALDALTATREAGYRRGLVVLATGLGKTWLAAFDAGQVGARRVLFVAHREEILAQAAETFLRIRPQARVGFYMGQSRDAEVDVLCASVQTLARTEHLGRFSPQHFDYVVVDEFHHAAASTYRRLLTHFAPSFLLGLTATPERTDQSDILSLCDDNLVFSTDLFDGIRAGLLAPFHYYGIWDESVDYREIPWRNGRFDPEQLSTKLATLARARHALKEWQRRAQARTLAFCVSTAHADFMAGQFNRAGIAAAAVYSGSDLGRAEALEALKAGQLKVIFSVDLFNEGVDLPAIDTVMMLRPTESKILFLQQLGRGLRRAEGKDKLVVLDFIGNHQSYLLKPQALFRIGATFKALAAFARKVETGRLELPDGCFVNYDLALVDFLKALEGDGPARDYEALKATFGRRPTLAEFYRSGSSAQAMRRQHGTWFELVRDMGDLGQAEQHLLKGHLDLLREVENTHMTKSFKMVLLEALLELEGLMQPVRLGDLAARSWQVLQRRKPLLRDLPEGRFTTEDGRSPAWLRYWADNPINAWTGGNRGAGAEAFFRLVDDRLVVTQRVEEGTVVVLADCLQELVDYRLAAYDARVEQPVPQEIQRFRPKLADAVELPYFPNLRIACGHFRAGRTDSEEHRRLPASYGKLDPARHFIARASGHSMDGGKLPIRDGDYLLLEHLTPTNAGSITGTVMAIERDDASSGEDQYVLRVVVKTRDGKYVLRANNPDYPDMPATDEMRTRARLRAIVDPLDLAVGQSFQREEIPPLFGETFNPGNWNAGHVVLDDKKVHVLLVTLNKQGKSSAHRYHDYWIDEHSFHWQTQNSTAPGGKKGREIITHAKLGIDLHLFVREGKLSGGKGAPFSYAGKVTYRSHTCSAPMSVIFDVQSGSSHPVA